MQRSRFRRLVALAVGLLAACVAPSPAPKPTPVNCCNVPWGYQEPENWAKLSPCYYECEEGGEQSPINIVNPSRQTLNAIDFAYGRASGLKSRNDGHKIIIDIPQATAGGIPLASLRLNGVTYILQQFHFHTPSEHEIRGNERPIEIHFVNVSPGGRALAIGVFVDRGANSELAKIWRNLPGDIDGELNLAGLLPPIGRRTSFRYAGSLTNPPCGQGYQWIVYHDAIGLDQAGIQKLRDMFSPPAFPHGNRRPVQDLNGRVVLTDVPQI